MTVTDQDRMAARVAIQAGDRACFSHGDCGCKHGDCELMVSAIARAISESREANVIPGGLRKWHDEAATQGLNFDKAKTALRGGVPAESDKLEYEVTALTGDKINDPWWRVLGDVIRPAPIMLQPLPPRAWTWAPEWLRHLGAFFRWNKSLVCEFSAKPGCDHHDYPDSVEGVPMHMHEYRCERCGKGFGI